MASERAQNLQDTFLNFVRKNKVPLTIFLVNGVKLQGVVTWFDNFCVLLRRDGHSQLVYKHAISTIMPGQPIQMFEPGEDTQAASLERAGLSGRQQSTRRRPSSSAPYLSARAQRLRTAAPAARAPDARLAEAEGLARAIDLDVVAGGGN